ncbi:MAG TPA: hypothetical protein VHR66_00075 [Gemmataceae bacterium]|jgi:hypothetical protein|nr:hypothetical protein [Gemmataceae bacterium]
MTRLNLETLDQRTLPSAAMAVVDPTLHIIGKVYTPLPSTHPLTGRGTGNYSSNMGNPDTGVTHALHGTAHLQGMGDVKVDGDIHGPGFIKSDVFHGTMTFKNGRGSVKLELTSFRPAGPARLPNWYRYKIVQATGAFKGMQDTGSLRVDVTLFPSFAAGPSQSGTFRLAI